MKRVIGGFVLLFISFLNSSAQQIEAYPSNWFANMNYKNVQVL
jgi:hypothetical protein